LFFKNPAASGVFVNANKKRGVTLFVVIPQGSTLRKIIAKSDICIQTIYLCFLLSTFSFHLHLYSRITQQVAFPAHYFYCLENFRVSPPPSCFSTPSSVHQKFIQKVGRANIVALLLILLLLLLPPLLPNFPSIPPVV